MIVGRVKKCLVAMEGDHGRGGYVVGHMVLGLG